MNKYLLVTLVGLVLFGLFVPATLGQAAELKVVTTFSILEDFVKQVGGTQVEVSSLVPDGADPHSWEPTPKEARLVAQADLLVANGGNFDHWLVNLQTSVAKKGVPLILASEGITGIEEQHHEHGGDPHFWLSVPNAVHYVTNITKALVELKPSQKEYFETRAEAYIAELEILDSKLLDQLGQIPKSNRVIVTYHNAFSYLADRYGFEVVEYFVANPEAEPSARDLARLVQLLKQQPKPAVFTEPQLNISKRYVQALATETEAKIYVLYSDSFDSKVTDYVQMMEHNGTVLLEALR